MITSRQSTANRRNGRLSTGPRTVSGKKRSARNAKRLGLSLSVLANPGLSHEVKALTAKLAGDGASSTTFRELAAEIAEAQVDLVRIRRARDAILTTVLGKNLSPKRSQCEAASPSQIDTTPVPPSDPSNAAKLESTKADPPPQDDTALCEAAHQLHAIHRYERRALSRRKFAIRMFDAARRREQQLRGAKTAGEVG
jgi:hypothetical protein